ncbi:MAG: aminoacylase [Betaproteobacteria bacterium]|nr:aminoacylase [Betaproteobacteria bacterium]
MLDLRIDNATIIDGSGAPRRTGSLGVLNGKITAVGRVDEPARKIIDAAGRVLAPGFIDIHTHYDAQVFWDPTLSPSSHYGITTIVGGNCGFSVAPLGGDGTGDYLMRMLSRVEGMPLESLKACSDWGWSSFGEYLDRFDGKLAINAAFMVGHSALRRSVMGARANTQTATAADIAAMQALLRESLRGGGLGLSTTISPAHSDPDGNPVPSRLANREELLALARVTGEFEGTSIEFSLNVQTEFDQDMVELMTDISLAAKRPLNWNALLPNAKVPQVYQAQLAASDYAAARGARVVPLVVVKPGDLRLNFSSGFVLDLIPGWAEVLHLPFAERKRALADPAVRRKLEADAKAAPPGMRGQFTVWEAWILGETFSPATKPHEGKVLGEVARAAGKSAFDMMLDIALADELKTTFLLPRRHNDDESWRIRGEVWRDARALIGASDAGAHLDMTDSFAYFPQLLSIGVREKKLIGLEDAVRQITSRPARLMGLADRGELKPGFRADIVIFDPDTVGHGPVHTRFDVPANAGRLFAEAIGVSNVFVNGTEIFRDGKFQGVFPGRAIRSGRDTRTPPMTEAA